MNVHEVAGLLSYFGSAWPKAEIPDDTADIWAMELTTVNVDVARTAAKTLVRTSTFMPSIAEFLDECQQEAKRRHIAQPVPALEPGEDTEPDFDFDAAMSDLRDKLANWSKATHNHKGPGPCPVCANAKEPA